MTSIEQTTRIAARPRTVWRFFTDPAGLEEWWGPATVDPRPGGILRVHMTHGPRPVMRGEFVELVPYERIVFTFGWEPAPGVPDIAPGTSKVEVTLVEDGDGTRLTLRHGGLPTALRLETTEGWAVFLHRLGEVATR